MTLTTPILDNAFRIAEHADVKPQTIKGRFIAIGVALLVGVVSAAITLVIIARQMPETEPARLLVSFVLLGSLALTLAALAALFVVVWSAYVYQYVQSIQAKSEVEETVEHMEEILRAIADMRLNRDFNLEIAQLLRRYNDELSRSGDSLRELSQDLYELIRRRIIGRSSEIDLLLQDAEHTQTNKRDCDRKAALA